MIDQTQQLLSELAAAETALAREKIQHATASGEFKKEVLEFERACDEKNALIDELLAALNEIAGSGGKTLLGRCCVERRCVPSEDGAACELQERANSAFSQMASIAKGAIAKARAKGL